MNYEDESYIRVYTRDTTNWLKLGWEAQSLLLLLMRKVDRAGVFEAEEDFDLTVSALAIHLRIPEPVVGPALQKLIKLGTVEHVGGRLIIANFVDAQTAAKTPRERQRESRQRKRDLARLGHDTRHAVTEPVTPGHAVTKSVTPILAYSNQSELSLSDPGVPFRMHDAWVPNEPTRASLRMHTLSEHADGFIDLCLPEFRIHFINKSDVLRDDGRWNNSFLGWVKEEWKRDSETREKLNRVKGVTKNPSDDLPNCDQVLKEYGWE